ncbi:box C/D snoRNA protein 1-like [Varroa destructor]|uniref:HIT-type domain-containing protein n=1 Tax=Varroa destructor TaxID=109461 RepID=A0A7M7M616_VARDE|nr:box C/D snoRNA protein 1-like [Varroa destructor]XP_022652053.1 box C/D snoRNA protein 1-like [Varroa destructor]XP_022652054.1 box C/D snoRNA protein 1-like [Varroa destructor]XP_022652055.1 box C/D snoRNA protein 1-like [Varroa destructor]
MANGIESTIPLQAVDIRSTSSDSLPPSFDENIAEDNVAKNSINSWNTQQFQINEIISRPKKCAVCHKTARYSCPRCSLRTCSLGCVKTHKKQTGCDGVRDRAGFIPMSRFTDLDLLSDYRFLEESARMVDSAVRNNIVKPHRRETLPTNLMNIQKFAWRRSKISLQFLPQMFKRRRLNRISIKKSHIHWTVELQVPQGQLIVLKHDIPSSTMVKEIVVQFLASLATHEQEKAAALLNASIGEICVLMKAVGRPANYERYFEFDLDLSLVENLRGKMLVEFPTLIIITTEHRGAFDIEETISTDQVEPTELPSFFREIDGSDNDENEQTEQSHNNNNNNTW